MRSSIISAAALAFASLTVAQTFTDCDPTKKTCPADPALGKTITVDFTKGPSSHFRELPGTSLTYGSQGAEFTIVKESNAPTIESDWYIFFGKVEVVMKAAPGQGIVSSVVLQSDVLDEVDWEWLGGRTSEVQTNYFGKGDTTVFDRGGFSSVAQPQATYHTYTIDWSSSAIKWSIDGAVVRTLLYADAKGGHTFPQTPMRVKLGNWVGGGSTQPAGTVEWAGGKTDMSQAPFTMYVKSITVQDATTSGSEYVYGDRTGDWQSIKVQGSSGGNFLDTSSSADSASSTAASSTSVSVQSTTSAPKSSTSVVATTTQTTIPSSSFSTVIGSTTSQPIANGTATVTSGSPSVTPTTGRNTTATTSGPAAASSSVSAASRYGVSDITVAALGLALGYLVL